MEKQIALYLFNHIILRKKEGISDPQDNMGKSQNVMQMF